MEIDVGSAEERRARGQRLARELIVAARVRGVEEAEAAEAIRNPIRAMRIYEVDSLVAPKSSWRPFDTAPRAPETTGRDDERA